MKALSVAHLKALEYVNSYFQQHQRRPTMKEIASTCGYASTSTAYFALKRIDKHGIALPGATLKEAEKKLSGDLTALSICVDAFKSCAQDERDRNLDYLISRFRTSKPKAERETGA